MKIQAVLDPDSIARAEILGCPVDDFAAILRSLAAKS
jgi:hypothetical protein